MLSIQLSNERGKSDLGWLQSRFSFSFADYYNQKRMNFGQLRVLNDDEIAPEQGFGAHPHKNMEIITIVTEGEVAHKDSTGSNGVTKAGEVQVMSAGFGVIHSEFNNSKTQTTKLFQIWIGTKEEDINPRYDQMKFDEKSFENKFFTIVSGEKKKGELYIHQDATIKIGHFSKDSKQEIDIKDKHGLFLFLQEGSLVIDNKTLNSRDSVEIAGVHKVEFTAKKGSRIIAITVPMI